MAPGDRIVLTTFLNRADADLAASQLRGHGIECWMEADDAGGMYPSLKPVKLLVTLAQAEAARAILDVPAPPVEIPAESAVDSNAPPFSTLPQGFLKFGGGLMIGLAVGVLVHAGWVEFRDRGEHTYRHDKDDDGVTDEEHVWRRGEYVLSRYDRNADGRFDFWERYQNGEPMSGEMDDNFDGRVDSWFTLTRKGNYSTARFDTDFNGVADATATYEHGLTKQMDWQPNGTNVVLFRQLYEHGVLREKLRDLNGDGKFDISIRYDAFNTPVATNELNKASKPEP